MSGKEELGSLLFLWDLEKPLCEQLQASACPFPRFYGLGKIRRLELRLWRAISAVGSALYTDCKYLVLTLRPLVGKGEYIIKNSMEFVQLLSEQYIDDDKERADFDAKSLYTSLPTQQTLVVVKTWLEKEEGLASRTPLMADEFVQMLEICLIST